MWRVLCRDCSWDIESTQRDCSQCDACGSERVSVTRAATLDEAQHEAFRAYVAHVTPEPHVSCAGALGTPVVAYSAAIRLSCAVPRLPSRPGRHGGR
jgi:hypothetical protein